MKTEELFAIVYDDHLDYKSTTSDKMVAQTRWSVYKSKVVEHIPTGKFFMVNWGEGATENQEGQDEHWFMVEAEPYEVTVVKYKPIIGGLKYESR